MQNTRLNTLFDATADRLGGWLQNPWRRISVLIIGLLFGIFLGPAISSVSGQKAELDVVVAAILAGIVELVTWITYRANRNQARRLLIQVPNAVKLGVVYSLFLEAFKLGS